MLAAPLRLPRYLDACLTHVLPDAMTAVSGGRPRVVPLPAGLRAVIVLVVDGLGRRLLDAHETLAPTLTAVPSTTVDAAFPSTTVTNLTSLATGLTPRRHGIAGTVLAVDGRRFVPLAWSWERLVGGEDARNALPPEHQQPLPTLFETMPDRGVRPVTVLRHDHVGSGLTRASLRGGEVRRASGLADTLTTAVSEAVVGNRPTVVYAHHADLDTAGHLQGPGSSRWCEELAAVDAAVATAAAALPSDVALVVTADHGQVRIEDQGLVEMSERPDLLRGVNTFAGDPRAPQLHVATGARDDVLAAWRDAFADVAEIRTREEAVSAGWFGPAASDADRLGRDDALAPTPDGPRRPATIGDVVVAARAPLAWVHADLDTRGGRMPGHHGSLTPDELEIPVAVLTGYGGT